MTPATPLIQTLTRCRHAVHTAKVAWRARDSRVGNGVPYTVRMDAVTWFGFLSLAGAMVCYALEERSHWYGLGFAIGCVLGSIYGFLIGAWPFGVVEALWTVIALRRWHESRKPAAA